MTLSLTLPLPLPPPLPLVGAYGRLLLPGNQPSSNRTILILRSRAPLYSRSRSRSRGLVGGGRLIR